MDNEVKIIDRARIGGVECGLEGGIARIEFRKDLNARSVKTGYGRLFFRQGKSFSTSLKLLSTDTRTQAGVGHLNISLPLRESIALVRSFCGVFCAPAAKIDIPYGRDVWLMLFTPMHNNPSIEVLKPMLTTDKVSIQACLSAVDGELRYSLSAYGSDFRRAGLELTRQYTQDGQQPLDVRRSPYLRSLQKHGQEKTSKPHGNLSKDLQNQQ
jgi:hypothetical protein